MRQDIHLFRKVIVPLLTSPGRSVCFARWKPSLVAVDQLAVANSSRAPACIFEVVDPSLLSTPTSDWNRIPSCSGLVKLKCKKPSKLVSRGTIPSSSVNLSTRNTPGPSDPVPIAGDRRGVPGFSDPVSTAARRGDGSHYGCGADCKRATSILKRSTSTFISSINSSEVCGRLG